MTRMKRHFLTLTYFLEIVISILIAVQVLLGTFELLRGIYIEYIIKVNQPVTYIQFEAFLGQALLLVVGLELIIMLVTHTPGSVIEALLYAIARKMLLIPKTSNSMVQIVLGVIAIAGLFIIKNHLIPKDQSIAHKDQSVTQDE
ncbi:hypothetical protein Curi_c10600 [Gottschalkia acidurici 9a]|uniref:Transporter n=2 Tax=Clostridium acidurici TaxID=1556 RepID=K0AXZ3_GOTA9|nr:hypothetical protein [Gottschalkia acidurici]AFS78074.1 hypothetical protein Curi_c10600 [Gottschalkia acidurici 9a]